jgi:hypothetical protein
LLGDKTDEERKEVPQSSLVDLLSLGRAGAGSNLENLLPSTQDHRDTLLDVYFANVDPMVRITHRPTVLRKFATYNHEAHPIAYAIYFSAINSLPPKVVQTRFGDTKEALLDRFQLGVEISLARENYLTTSDLEIFQGFVLWLTCITREEDMGRLINRSSAYKADIDIRQSMGVDRHSFSHRPESGLTPRPILVSHWINGRPHY